MDITNSWAAAARLSERFKAEVSESATAEAVRKSEAFAVWKEKFSSLFTSLEYREVNLLKYIGQYETLVYLYEKVNRSGLTILRQEDHSALLGVMKAIEDFRGRMAVYAKKDRQWDFDKPVLTTKFPLAVKEVTTDTLTEELSWFLKVLTRAHSDVSADGEIPIVQQVDNVDVSVSIAVDWQFMLVTLTFLSFIGRQASRTLQKKKAMNSLRDLGTSAEIVDAVEQDLAKDSQHDLDVALLSIAELLDIARSDGLAATLTAYFNRLRDADTKGYRIGVDLPQKPGEQRINGRAMAPAADEGPLVGRVRALASELQKQEAEESIAGEMAGPTKAIEGR